MNKPLTKTRRPQPALLLAAALGLPASLALATTPLLSDDFESHSVDEQVPEAGSWAVVNTGGGSLIVRDENTAIPFGSPNQYVELDDITDDGSGPAVRLQSQPVAAASNALTTLSFDFSEPASGGDGRLYVGYPIDDGDLNTAGRRIRIALDDGEIREVSGGTNTYALDTAYRLHLIFNDSADAVNYPGGTIDSGTAAVWLMEFTFPIPSGSRQFARLVVTGP